MRSVAFASIFAGVSGYLVIFLATSSLGAERFDVFNIFWGLFFMLHGVLQGIMHETTRGVRAENSPADAAEHARDPDADDLLTGPIRTGGATVAESGHATADLRPTSGARPWPIAAAMGAVTGGLVLATSPLWASAVLADHAVLGTALAAVAAALVAVQAVLFGALSGSGRWNLFALLVAVEALARIVVAGLAVAGGFAVEGFLYATVAGIVATPLALAFLPEARATLRLRVDVAPRQYLVRAISAMLAASAAAVLVVGFPVILKAARPDAEPVVLSNLLLAVTLTRAPILVPLTSFQNAIVVFFVDRAAQGRRVLLVPIAAVTGVAVVGAALAWLVGPPIIAFMGHGFSVGGELLAMLVLAAGCTGVLFITGSAVLAREHHWTYVAGWWIASAVAIVVLLVVPEVSQATVLALAVGPALGALVHVAIGMRARRD